MVEQMGLLAILLFCIGLVWSLVHHQSVLPVMGNDAMTYHLPAAVQWLQTGRLGVFQFGVRPIWGKQVIALGVLLTAVLTAYKPDLMGWEMFFVSGALELVAVGLIVAFLTRKLGPHVRWGVVGVPAIVAGFAFAFVYWSASLRAYQHDWFVDGSGWQITNAEPEGLWRFVDQHVPRDATVAYTDLYLIYPLQGFSLDRRLVYAPMCPGLATQSDLPWLGDRLSGEELVPAAVKATVGHSDRATWLQNLRASNASFLIVGKGGAIDKPPEAEFVAADPK